MNLEDQIQAAGVERSLPGVISFEIPGEPVPFARAGGGKSKGRFTPTRQRSFMGMVKDYAARAMKAAGRKGHLFDGAIRLTVEAAFVRPASWSRRRAAATFWKSSKPDVDNIAKIIKDACNKVVWTDDARVADLRVTEPYGDVARVVVTVSALEDETVTIGRTA